MRYTHPILKRNAEDIQEYNRDSKHPYRIIVWDWLDGKDGIRYSKYELFALWFQPVEETKTDWIDDAYEEWQHTVTYNDIKYFYRDEFRQVIEKHQPKSDVCNLVPIDADDITTQIWELLNLHNYDKLNEIEQILSKYGTTSQKKRSRLDADNWYNKYRDMKYKEVLYIELLRYLWLLEG